MINEKSLLEIGFKKQYGYPEGFFTLDIDDKLFLTVNMKTLIVSIQVKGYGHVQKLEHIKTIEQISSLIYALTGKDQGREKDIMELCQKVIDTSAFYEYNSNSHDRTICPFCHEFDFGDKGNMNTIDHKNDCAWLLAKDLTTNLI